MSFGKIWKKQVQVPKGNVSLFKPKQGFELDNDEDKCCEEARSQWIAEVRADIGQDEGYDIPPGGYLDGENLQNTSIIHRYENMSCEELREVLEDISGRKPGLMYKYHYTERKGHFGSPTILYYIGKDLLENWDRCEKNVQ